MTCSSGLKMKSSRLYLVLVALLFISETFGAKILGIVPTPFYSHQIAFHSLWRELCSRGHQVTLLSTIPINDRSLENLREIDLSLVNKPRQQMNMNKIANLSAYEAFVAFKEIGAMAIEEELKHPDVQRLIADVNQHYDVALIESINPGIVGFAERLKCPLIQLFSLDAPSAFHYFIGNPIEPILNPDPYLPFSENLTFFERLSSTVFVGRSLFYFKYVSFPSQELFIRKHVGNGFSSIEEILRNTSLMFTNTDYNIHSIRASAPNVVPIGGGSHLAKPKPLPQKLQNILDDGINGVIYFSLGSNVKSGALSQGVINACLETFSKLPQTIVWKFEEQLHAKPTNVYISKWLPQQDVLRHPNVKLFISQGGQQSIEEAMHNQIPIIGIPFFGDQERNLKKVTRLGIGIMLDLKSINETVLKSAILEILDNPKYRNRLKYLKELNKDQLMTGLESAVWWTEYVVRHKGAKHLRSTALDLPDLQYYLLDVLSFCLLVIVVMILVLIKLGKLAVRCLLLLLKIIRNNYGICAMLCSKLNKQF